MSTESTRRPLFLGLIAVGIVLAAFSACAAVVAGVWYFGSQQPKEQAVSATAAQPKTTTTPAAPKLWSRREFESAVTGKTKDQVIGLVGRPDDTEQKPGGSIRDGERGVVITFRFEWWTFRNRVLNEATGKPYSTARIRFSPEGKVDTVELP